MKSQISTVEYEAMAAKIDSYTPPSWDYGAFPDDPSAIESEATYASDTRATGIRSVVLTCGSDLTPEPVIWLWRDWLARGKFHILAGAPGQGKTTIAVALAAAVSIGGRFPDGSRCEPGNVLIWSGEDDAADTLLPRLIASGADRSKCFFISGTRCGDEVQPFDPARDMAALAQQAGAIGGVSLIVVDPVVSAVTGDSHKNAEVRRSLQPLVDLAGKLGAAVLGITHLSKGGAGSDPASRIIGSIAFTAVARVVMIAAKIADDEGQTKRILARAKSNIGPDDGGFEYHIEQGEALPGIEACFVTWGNPVEGTARELMADSEINSDTSDDQNDAASSLKEEITPDCWTPAKQVFKSMADAGFSKDQIKRAAKKLHILKKKGGMSEGWYWRLPGNFDTSNAEDVCQKATEGSTTPHEGCEECTSFEGAPFAPFGHKSLPSGDVEDAKIVSESVKTVGSISEAL